MINRIVIKVIVVLVTLFANFLLAWCMLFEPFAQLLVDKNQPYHSAPFNRGIFTLHILILLTLVVSSVYMVVVLFIKRGLSILAPLFSLVLIIALLVISKISLQYPSSRSYETTNGHFYIDEIWWEQPNHIRVYKRWKSIRPYDERLDPSGSITLDDTVKYTLDSVSEVEEPH